MNSASLEVSVRKARRDSRASFFTLDVQFQISSGITIVFGPSGAGKSTLLDCIAGLLQPDAGRISLSDEIFFDSGAHINLPSRARRIAYVFQSLALFPHMTVERNIAYGLSHLPLNRREPLVQEALKTFHVAALAKRKPAELSGGEKQRVALARSLVTSPRLLLLDEPLTGLDAALKNSIVDDLRFWNGAHQIPILYVTHNREEVDAMGERVLALDSGKIIAQGTPREVLDMPKHPALIDAAGFENIFDATVLHLDESGGAMRVRLVEGPCEMEVPLGHAAAGSRIRVAIRAGDILLATQRPVELSARNILQGKIVSLESRSAMAVARVDCGTVFTVHITSSAVRELELSVGKTVWLVLKTHSAHSLVQ